jgi:hypothetical protein
MISDNCFQFVDLVRGLKGMGEMLNKMGYIHVTHMDEQRK